MLGSTKEMTFELQLPLGDGDRSLIDVIVHVRDYLNSVAVYVIPNVSVQPDKTHITSLIDVIKASSTGSGITSNKSALMDLLNTNDALVKAQVITTVSQVINRMTSDMLESARESKQPKFFYLFIFD